MLSGLVARLAGFVTHGEPPRVFAEIGRHPRLFRAWLPFAGALLLRGDLPRADTEIVILRTASNCDCRDELIQHVPLAQRAGVTEAEIDAIPIGEDDPAWTWRRRVLLRAVDELHDYRRIQPATASFLELLFTDRQVLELCLLVGHYEMLAMVLNTRAAEPEPSALARAGGSSAVRRAPPCR
jgi:alkylhydroperoxidase family enzyme